VNKPVEGETVVCWLCHKKGHESCKAKTMGEYKKKPISKISNTIFDQEEEEWKGDSHQGQQASQHRERGQTDLGGKEDYFNHKRH
jgi:hypothetical protein